MSTADEFKAVLALQNEIDQKLGEFIARIQVIMNANQGRRIIATIDGKLYELDRIDIGRQATRSAQKHGGFFSQYRLIELPDPIK